MSKKPDTTVSKIKFYENKLLHILFILIIGVISYSNTFNVPFQWDEPTFIKNNPIIKDAGYFLEPSKAKDLKFYKPFIRRYITYLTFAINYNLHGYKVTGYHIVNLLIHLLNALFVYFFVVLAFKTPFLRASQLKNSSGFVALFAALLFVSHPLQTMAVTYIYQRLASLAAFFYLLSLLFYIKSRLSQENASRYMLYCLSLLSTIIAMKTKENAFTLPFAIILFEFFFFSGQIKMRMLRLVPLLITLFIIPFSLIGSPLAGDSLGNTEHTSLLRDAYLFTQFKVLVNYVKLLFFPVNQTVLGDFQVSMSFFDIKVFLSFLLLLGIFCFGIYLFIRSRTKTPDLRLVAFGIFWFFITHAVESSIIPLLISQEYRMYLPSVGVFMGFSAGIFLMFKKLKCTQTIAIPIIIGIALILSSVTYSRNAVWKSDISLWEDVIKKAPNSFHANYNLGLAYEAEGLTDIAIKYYETAIKLKPNYSRAYNNLGIIYAKQGRLEDALKTFRIAANFDPDFAEARTNIGVIYEQLGHFEEAAREFQAAIRIDPAYVTAHINLGVIFGKQGRIEAALKEFQTAKNLDPYQDEAKKYLEIIQKYKK